MTEKSKKRKARKISKLWIWERISSTYQNKRRQILEIMRRQNPVYRILKNKD